MKFLIATAALFCSLVVARPGKLGLGDYTYAGCTILGNCDIPIYSEPSEDSEIVGYYSPGDRVVFDCYVERGEDEEDVVNTFNDITSPYWDYNSYGYFPEAYVEVVCAETIDTLCDDL